MIFFVHRYTDLDTARTEAELQTERLAQVMPAAASSSETPYRANGALSILAGYSEENELVGYCVEVQAQGFGGVITMEVGVDLNGQVTGVAVTSHKETAGVGTRAMTPAALSRYVGRYGTLRTPARTPWTPSAEPPPPPTPSPRASAAPWPSWPIWMRRTAAWTM